MKKYDLVLLLDHEMKKEDRETFLSDLESKLGKGVLEKDEIGLLNLKYDLSQKKGKDRAYFVSYYLDLDNEALEVLRAALLYNKSVLRYAIYAMGQEEKFHKYEELNKTLNNMIEGRGKQRFGQKVRFYANDKNIVYLTWKAVPILQKYVSRFGDIKPRLYTGNSISRQKKLRSCVIRARELGLVDYIK